jgi:hypothetical protein
MKLNQVEQHLVDTVGYLKGIGLETFLTGSTLLQIIRSGKYEIRHELDREVNLGCKAEDLTDEILDKIGEDFSFYLNKGGYIIFGQQGKDCWAGNDCFAFLGFHEKVADERIETLDGGKRLVWESSHIDKLRKVKYKGYEFNVPSRTKRWLHTYFGDGWEKEDLTWNWSRANNLLGVTI